MKVQAIIDHEGDEIHKSFEHSDLLLGFQFMADMINRLFFVIIVLAEVIAFSASIFTTMGKDSEDVRLEDVRYFESQNQLN